MGIPRIGWALALVLAAGPALAESTAKPLRLVGEAPGAAAPAPTSFVIDARLKAGDADFQSTLDGWFAATAPAAASGDIEGSCVERRCALTVSLDDVGKLAITGDFGEAAGPVQARYVLKDDEGKTVSQGPLTLRPMTSADGAGPLAAPGDVSEAELSDLLMWVQQSGGFGYDDTDAPPSSFQREGFATWQGQKGRPATGLIYVSDLAELRAEAEAARKACGWTTLGDKDHGWSVGYPAAVFPKAGRSGGERRFSSADGKAQIVVAVEPALSSEAFDAFVEKTTADREGRTDKSYTRVNSDMEIRYEEAGVVTSAAYHNRAGGMARIVLTYPVKQGDAYAAFDTIVPRSLKVTDDLKP